MGLNFLGSSSNYDVDTGSKQVGNTFSTTKFRIIKSEQLGDNLLVMVQYPDCTNYEGNKILFYEDCTIERLLSQGSIDPHFSTGCEHKSPVARFAPIDVWWSRAIKILKNY